MQTGEGDIALNASIAKCPHGLTFGTNQAIQCVRVAHDLCNPCSNLTNYLKTKMKGVNMEINEHFADNLANLTESELWQVSRYIADCVTYEIKSGKTPDKHTIFWALDAILGGALE